jgi:uncharacterized protein YndB with AHSA1/START domain/predicted enzyme related to lactoylglutathione lyase
MVQSAKAKKSGKNEIVITRVYDAPRELLWEAWTEPERIMRWWGPKNFTSPAYKIDLTVGGEYIGAMKGPDGKLYWSKGFYLEIYAPERLIMTDSFADENGNIVPASYYGMGPGWPKEMLVTLTFEANRGKTGMTIRHSGLEGVPDKDRANMEQGWNEQLDKLADYLNETQKNNDKIMPKMNSVIHFEIPASDLNRARSFYRDFFGWDIVDIPGMEQTYSVVRTAPVDEQNMLKKPGAINGGIAIKSADRDCTVLVIDVPSIDDYLDKLTKAGSKVIQTRQDVMGMGLYARVTDSEGNIIGLWETIKK